MTGSVVADSGESGAMSQTEGRKLASRNRDRMQQISRAVRRLLVIVVAATLLNFALAYLNDRWSCQRGQHVRDALNLAADYFAGQALRWELRAQADSARAELVTLDRKAAAQTSDLAQRLAVRQLSCDRLLPSTR